LSYNSIFEINAYTFSHLTSLERLYFKSNRLSIVHHFSFLNLHSLIVLDLSLNKLAYFNENHFVGLFSLKMLILKGNTIGSLGFLRSNSLKSLEVLNMESNFVTKLNDLNNVSFQLKSLNLNSNPIRNISNLNLVLKDLQSLELANSTTQLIHSTLSELPYNLTCLDLSFNKIEYSNLILLQNLNSVKLEKVTNISLFFASFLTSPCIYSVDLSHNDLSDHFEMLKKRLDINCIEILILSNVSLKEFSQIIEVKNTIVSQLFTSRD
jgi:hypothetical protein